MSETIAGALPLQDRRILVTRTREQAAALSARLGMLGALPIEFPAIRIVPPQDWTQLDVALARLYRTNEDAVWSVSHRIDGVGADVSRPGEGWGIAPNGEIAPRPPGRDTSAPTQQALPSYSWLIFTSANAVRIFCERLRTLGYEPSALRDVRIAAIGPATAAALSQYDLAADLVPGEFVAESVAAALIADSQQRGETLEGKHILLPRAAEARDVLTTTLRQAEAIVDEIPAYATLPASNDDEASQVVLAMLRAGQIDVITFTSSSTVRHFMRWLSGCLPSLLATDQCRDAIYCDPISILCNESSYGREPLIACIGPITAQTAREHGLDVQIEASTFTIDGLVTAIIDYYHLQPA